MWLVQCSCLSCPTTVYPAADYRHALENSHWNNWAFCRTGRLPLGWAASICTRYTCLLCVFFSFRKWDTKAYRMTVDGTHWTRSQPNNLRNAPGFTEVKEERTNIYIEMSVKFRWMALHMKISLFSWEIRMQNSRQWTHCALCWSVWFYLQIRFN